MKTARIVLLALACLLAVSMLAGCATTFKAENGKLAYGEIKGAAKGSFEARKPAIAILNPYIFPLTKPQEKLDEMIAPAVKAKGGNAATNVEIRYGFDLLGLVIASVTGGILNWGYCSVSGTAIAQ